jgi:tetratricopeptide (TPR) repeat protein
MNGTNGKGVIHSVYSVFSLLLLLLVAAPIEVSAQRGFTVFGNVALPDGQRAVRVRVRIEGTSGLQQETLTDDQGVYQFFGIPGGRYKLTVTNLDDDTQFTDPTEADTSRSFSNRLQVHLYLRYRMTNRDDGKKPKGGIINVAEAHQEVPKRARKAYEEGTKFRREGKIEQAFARLDQAISDYPTYFQALAERGEMRLQRREIDLALTDFEGALKVNSDYVPALRGAGVCLLERKQPSEAADRFARAATLDPEHASTQMMLGYAYILIEQYDHARKALEQALRLDPQGVMRAHVYLADLNAREGKFKEAADELWIYIQANPTAPDIARLRAMEIQLRARAVND